MGCAMALEEREYLSVPIKFKPSVYGCAARAGTRSTAVEESDRGRCSDWGVGCEVSSKKNVSTIIS